MTHPATKYLKLQLQQYRRCQESLSHFTKSAWHIVEPGPALQWNWHHPMVAKCIQAVVNHALDLPGPKIQKCIINVPFGSTKTTIGSIMLCPKTWTTRPDARFNFISHSHPLSIEASVNARAILDSAWYQTAWGNKVRFTRDQAEKTKYQNTARGFRACFGMTGFGTGIHGDVNCFDDPHDAEKAMYSVKILQSGVNAYKVKWQNRLNDPRKSGQVVIMQRVNPDDLSGYLLGLDDGWEHLWIPFTYDPEKARPLPLGLKDPRTRRGELYWPERYNQEWYEAQKLLLGSYGIACQLEQDPISLTTGIVKLHWFRRYKNPPAENIVKETVQFWDTAQKGEELVNSPWVCLTAKRTINGYYIVDVYREWHDYPAGKEAVKRLANQWEPSLIVIEDKSTGASLIQELPGELNIPILPFEPELDKVARLGVESPSIESGKVSLPENAPWLSEFEREIQRAGPSAEYMDQADALSMMLKYFRLRSRDIGTDFSKNTEGWPDE